MIRKEEAIRRIRYSSGWNKPCPEWVYNLIEHMPDEDPEEEKEDESTTLS